MADNFDDGLKAYQSGNKTKAKELFGKAYDFVLSLHKSSYLFIHYLHINEVNYF